MASRRTCAASPCATGSVDDAQDDPRRVGRFDPRLFGGAGPARGVVSDPPANAPRGATPAISPRSAEAVTVTSAPDLGRTCEVVAVLDMHTPLGDERRGFAELRRWAATLGGDAVVAARFQPATATERAHLFGVVVRSRAADARPYDVLAELEAQTDEDGPDKGLDALRAAARELGADKIVDVRFVHDAGDGVSRVTGLAIRYRR